MYTHICRHNDIAVPTCNCGTSLQRTMLSRPYPCRSRSRSSRSSLATFKHCQPSAFSESTLSPSCNFWCQEWDVLCRRGAKRYSEGL